MFIIKFHEFFFISATNHCMMIFDELSFSGWKKRVDSPAPAVFPDGDLW